ncbi:MAG: multidrug effflux MFS transporter [Proteobacteria bacterium]|nr:multidrug effflux MFS transporter [Pseudomonadota bacterium]
MAPATTDSTRAAAPVWLLIATTALGTSSLNIFVPAMPELVAAFASDIATVNLALSLFLVTIAIGQLICGPIADRHGRRRTLLAGLVIFEVATALCALAPSLELLIAGRIVQAIGACATIVVVRAMVRDSYERERAASVLGFITMVMAVAPALSVALGGYLVERLGWRAGFVVLALAGGAIAAAAVWQLPETLRTSLHLGDRGGLRATWLSYRLLLRSPVFVGFALCLAFTSGAYFAFMAGAPFIIVGLLGRTPTEFGLSFLVIAVGYSSGSFVAARYSVRSGIDRMIIAGTALALAACAAWLIAAHAGAIGMIGLFAPMVVLVFGNGIAMPNAIAAAISVEPRAAGTAAGLVGCAQMAIGAPAMAAVAWLDDGTVLPLIIVMTVTSVLAALAYALAVLSDRAATAARAARAPAASAGE